MFDAEERTMTERLARKATRRVLLVEDTLTLAYLYREYLVSEGIEADIVTSGEEAIRVLGETSYEVVLLDVQLPGCDGTEVLRFMTENGVPARGIVVTAYGCIDKTLELMRAGAFDFIQKPVAKARLIEAVRGAFPEGRKTS